MAAGAWWLLGYPDQAPQRIRKALTLARTLADPYSLALALFGAAWLHQLRREGQETQEQAEALLALSTEQGFPFLLPLGTMLQGWALAEQGQAEEGIVQMRHGLAASQAIGTELQRSYWLALLAEAYGKAGQAEAGLAALTEALTVVDKSGERSYEAELYRLKGELRLQSESQSSESPPREAEACFQKAIEIARRQSAKSLELRSVMSLSRLWQQQGKQREAHELLAEIYGWFTEGFDTKDLQEAKALLAELAEGV
jgi:predicted ATPase